MELKIEPVAIPEKIAFNYEELKAWATDIAKSRENIVFTGTKEEITLRKKDRSELNRIDKMLNDERIRLEREYMKPFDALKSQINEVRGIIKNSSNVIDGQIKEIEEKQRQEKKEKIAEYFFANSHPEWLTLSMIWEDKWMNASVSMKSIQAEIDSKIAVVETDLATLSNLSEFAFEAIETYKNTLDVNKSIAEGHRLAEMQKRKAEQEKMRAEQERIQREQENQKQKQLHREYEEEVHRQEEKMKNHPNYPAPSVKPDPEMREWVSFKAFLTLDDAKALSEFFKSRNIEFGRI